MWGMKMGLRDGTMAFDARFSAGKFLTRWVDYARKRFFVPNCIARGRQQHAGGQMTSGNNVGNSGILFEE